MQKTSFLNFEKYAGESPEPPSDSWYSLLLISRADRKGQNRPEDMENRPEKMEISTVAKLVAVHGDGELQNPPGAPGTKIAGLKVCPLSGSSIILPLEMNLYPE